MKLHNDSAADEAQIELIPLIDVVFCILTFFILAALQLTRQQAITVDLPKAKTGETQMQKMLIVGIDTAGQTYIEQQPVNTEQLDRALLRFQRWNPNGLMVLYAPKEARYNDVVRVLDKLRSVGGERVALATLPSSTPPTSSPNLLNPNNLQSPLPPTNPTTPNALPPVLPTSPNLLPADPNSLLGSPTTPQQPSNPFLPSDGSLQTPLTPGNSAPPAN